MGAGVGRTGSWFLEKVNRCAVECVKSADRSEVQSGDMRWTEAGRMTDRLLSDVRAARLHPNHLESVCSQISQSE